MHLNYAELFVWMLLGHMVGDYWLQNDWMARRKSESWPVAILHGVIYSWAVLLFVMLGAALQGRWFAGDEIVYWFGGIGIPHVLIDHYSLGSKFMALKNGIHPWKILKKGDELSIEKLWAVAFTAPVYIVTDNLAHLLMLWFMVRFLL